MKSINFPIPKEREEIYKYYQLDFDVNGCPMKRVDGKLVFHPLYPAYLMNNYMGIFQRTHEKKYLTYAKDMASLSLSHSSDFLDSRVFFYEANSPLVNKNVHTSKFYSALTQSRWIDVLCQIERIEPDSFVEEIKLLYNSLLIDIKSGGVLRKIKQGWVAEEYPKPQSLMTLNGWLTVLNNLIKNIDILNQDKYATKISVEHFLNKNFDALESLLPLYDLPALNNSRYQLSGASQIKIIHQNPLRCQSFSVSVPNEDTFNGTLTRGGRWANHLLKSTSSFITFNVVFGLASFPEKNIFNVELYSDTSQEIDFYVGIGDFIPRQAYFIPSRWKQFKEKVIVKKGINRFSFPVPYDPLSLFAYPTPFTKYLEGKGTKPYNTYHFIHINGLESVYHYSNRKVFRYYLDLWKSYVPKWEEMKILKNVNINQYKGNNK
jgi:hypothetical protein